MFIIIGSKVIVLTVHMKGGSDDVTSVHGFYCSKFMLFRIILMGLCTDKNLEQGKA